MSVTSLDSGLFVFLRFAVLLDVSLSNTSSESQTGISTSRDFGLLIDPVLYYDSHAGN